MRSIRLAFAVSSILLSSIQIAVSADDLGNGGKGGGDTVNHPCTGLKCKNQVKATGATANMNAPAKKPAVSASGEITGPKIPVPPPKP